jgi:hypothetical protein
MPHYVALIHKDSDSCYGVSFPDGSKDFPGPRTIDHCAVIPSFGSKQPMR